MAVDIFLKLTDIDGESRDDAHKNEIEVLAWSWDLSQAGTFHTGGGGGAGKANFGDLNITKYVDKSSTELMSCVACGAHIAEANLVVRKAGSGNKGDKPLEYLKINMKEVMVTSVATGGASGEERLTETVSFNFAEVETVYTQQTETGGEGAEVRFGRNIAENKPT